MRQSTISEKHGTHHTVVAEFWILAGVIALVALGDALAVSVVAVAVVITAWWIYREVEHRVALKHAAVAPVTHLQPAQRALKAVAAQPVWHGPHAA
ncbi:MAG: hypothetical protein WCB80_20560 [Mycobacterium sp.]